MKNITAIALLLLTMVGSYTLGKVSSDTWWKSEIVYRAQTQARQITGVDRALYDWKRPIKVGIYVGCGTKKLFFENGSVVYKDLDYAFHFDTCGSGEVSFKNVSVMGE